MTQRCLMPGPSDSITPWQWCMTANSVSAPSQEVISQRNPSAPAFRRGTAASPAQRAAPAPPAEPEDDNPYALFMAGDNEAVDEVRVA